MNWIFIQQHVYARAQKTSYEIEFICHSNNSEVFPFLDLPSNFLWAGFKSNLFNFELNFNPKPKHILLLTFARLHASLLFSPTLSFSFNTYNRHHTTPHNTTQHKKTKIICWILLFWCSLSLFLLC